MARPRREDIRYGFGDEIYTAAEQYTNRRRVYAMAFSGSTIHLCVLDIRGTGELMGPIFVRCSVERIPRRHFRDFRDPRFSYAIGALEAGVPWKTWRKTRGHALLDAVIATAGLSQHQRLSLSEATLGGS